MYIIKLNFVGNIPYYVRANDDNTWDEIYNPHDASTFKNKKDASDWMAKNTTFAEYATPVSEKAELKRYDQWVVEGSVRRHFDCVNNNLSRKYNEETPDEVLDWQIQIHSVEGGPDSIRYEDYETWPDLFVVFQNLHSVERYYSKDYSETYLSFKMSVKRDSTFEVFKEELFKVLDKITLLDDDGSKIISIFDHYCGEGGNFASFFIHPDGTYSIKNSRFYGGIERVSLEQAFDYWKKERYYGDGDEDAPDDDEDTPDDDEDDPDYD